MIPLHPQACPGRPEDLRWVTAPGLLPFTGPATTVPAALAELMDDGTLVDVHLEPAAIRTRLGRDRTWDADGPRVRTALHAALSDPSGPAAWGAAPAPDAVAGPATGSTVDDRALRTATERLLDGPVGDLARSHGGTIELVDVHAGVVRVRMTGACDGCPAAAMTMHVRLEADLRRAFPSLRGVVAVGRPGDRLATLRRRLTGPGRRFSMEDQVAAPTT